MTGLMRGWTNNAADNVRKLSPKWAYCFVNGGENVGTWFTSVFDVLRKLGAPSWSDWAYSGTVVPSNVREWSRDPAVWRSAISNRFDQVGRVQNIDTDAGLAQAKALLNNGYLLLYATNIDGWKRGILSDDSATAADNAFAGQGVCRFVVPNSSGHAMTIVGYNDDVWTDINKNGVVDPGEKGALKIVNSWGTSWGNAGFLWIAYDALKTVSQVQPTATVSDFTVNRATGYQTPFWGNEVYWITARAAYTPSLLGQFTLSHAQRNQLWVRMGRSATTATTPASYWPVTTTDFTGWQNGSGWPEAFKYLGGPYAFDGTSTAVAGTFVLDLTDLVVSGSQRYYLEITDSATGSAATVSDFKLTNCSGGALATATNGIPLSADAATKRAYVDFTASPLPVISSALTATATVGQSFSYTITANNSPTSFAATNLPAGLSVNGASGLISGTPAQAGTFPVAVAASNSSGSGFSALTLTVNATLAPSPVITSGSSASGTVGQAFSYAIAASNNPTSFGATGLPGGISVNLATGLISGTPVQAGTYTVTVTATNSAGTGSGRLVLTVAAATVSAPVITSSGSASGASGAAFTYRIEASNSPTSFGASGLPSGLVLNTTTGVIAGTLPVARSYEVTLAASNTGGTGYKTLVLQVTGGSSFGPANDAFANRVPLSGVAATTTGANVNATAESGEPAHGGFAATNSVWWSWTAPGNGVVTVDTIGSNFDTVLAIYTGTAVNGLATTASDNDSGGSGTSRTSFTVTGGVTYQIAVDGYAGAQGSVKLNIAFTGTGPANDSFANRIALTGTSVSTSGTNANASAEAGEPAHASNVAVKSVWWTWTAPQAGRATIDTIGSSFDTVLGIYTGTAVNALTTVASDDQGGGNNTSRVTFTATAGTTYQIAVDGWQGAAGSVKLNIVLGSAGPANDAFVSRILLSGAAASVTGSNVGATAEAAEPAHAGYAASKSVWWTWTAPQTGRVTIDTIGSNFDTLLAVYRGTTLASLTGVASDDDSGGNGTSSVTINVTGGAVYQIVVDGWGGSEGSVKLNMAFLVASQPANDNFTNRATLTGTAANATAVTFYATAESGEPAHAGSTAAKSIWWRWTAPQSGLVTIATTGSDFDTVLAVYTGTAVNALVVVASNDDGDASITSSVTFFAKAGTAYAIAVDGYGGGAGTVLLSLSLVASNELYATNFEAFTAGADRLNGTDGWLSTNNTAGASGIFNGFGGTDKTAWLGFNPTADASVFVWRPVSYDPIAAGTPGIQFQVDFQVVDSTNSRRDRFWFQLYNLAGDHVCSIGFDNATQRIYRFDGVTSEDVGGFARSTRYPLSVKFDFSTNLWSATLGGTILFTGKPMTSIAGRSRSLGNITALWQMATQGASGNNYMIFDNYRIALVPTNDAFANATALNGTATQVSGNNQGASKETGEPNHAGTTGGSSVWWRWTAPAGGLVVLTTNGSTFDTVLAVYTGSAVNTLSPIASNDDTGTDRTSALTFTAVAGTTYWIAVDGYGGATGAITLTLANVNADLALTGLTVTPTSVTAPAFTGCSFNLVNNGPALLSANNVLVEYYLSANTTFGDSDDVKIGDTGLIASIASGASTTVTLSSTGLANMVRLWPVTQAAGSYYVFARVTIIDSFPIDPSASNNFGRTSGVITYTKASQTLTFGTLANKTYGDAAFVVSATASSGLAPAYSVVSGPATISGNSVTITGAGTVVLRASQAGNSSYAPAPEVDRSFVVNKAPLTARAVDKSKVYGASNPALTGQYIGLVNGDTNSAIAAPSISTTATANSPVGTYPITQSGGSAANYTLTLENGTLTVTKAPLTVTAENQTRVYGAANSTVTLSYAGFVNNETASAISPPIASTPATTGSGVGTYPITLAGGSAANYTLTLVNGTLTVTKATPTLSWAAPSAITYGTALSATQLNASAGSVTGGFAYSPAAGTVPGAGTQTLNMTFTPTDAVNYSTATRSQTLTVNKAALTVTAANQSRPYGAANPAFTFAYTGFVNNDTAASLTTAPTASTSATTASLPGTYPVTLAGGSAANYTLTLANGNLTVTKAPLTATAANKSRIYGAANPAFTIAYAGFVNGDTAASLAFAPTAGTTATATSLPGVYPITLTGGTAANYALTLVNGTLTITPRDYSGTYFGTFASGGHWALYVRVNSTATYIAYLPSRHSAIIRELIVGTDGAFTVTGSEIKPAATAVSGQSLASPEAPAPRTAAAAGDYTLTGTIAADGGITGGLTGLGETFTGAVAASAGAAQSSAGLYTASALGTASGTTYAIVGATGQAVIVTTTPATVDGATGTVNASGQLAATTSNNAALSLTINPTAHTVSASVTPSGSSTPVIYGGVAAAVTPIARVVNLSVRTTAGTGDQTLIVGLVIIGSGNKTLLLRGIGPTLSTQNVSNPLADPTMRLLNGSGAQVAANNDWGGSAQMSANFASVGAFALPANSKDAALFNTLSTGLYSFHTFPNGSGTGIVLAEVYDADDDTSAASVFNISARTQVGTGENILIAGFVISGNSPKTILIRGLGPTLAAQGVAGALVNPQLIVFGPNGLVGANNDWGGTTALKDAFAATGAGALTADNSKDSALLVTLQPGVYSAQVSGVGATTGIGLVEIFLVP
jgi:hypothetical protein